MLRYDDRRTLRLLTGLPGLLVVCVFMCGMNLMLAGAQSASTTDMKPDVPIHAAKRRKLVVAHDGSERFSSIQSALDVSQPGDTILVKNGTYAESPTFTRSGARALPIALINYPGHHPIIVPASTPEHAVILKAQWIIVEGFEIRQGYDGVILYQGHNTIRGNYIHNSGDLSNPTIASGQGILVVSCQDVLITKNRIERNGLRNTHPFQVHGIYLSDFYHTGIARIVISHNTIRAHGGGAFHAFIGAHLGFCRNILIENNLLEDNAHEIICVQMSDSVIRNNTIHHNTCPTTDSPTSTIFWFELSPHNVIIHNQISSTESAANFYAVKTVSPDDKEVFDSNTWKLPDHTAWMWHGAVQSDFNTNFPLQIRQEQQEHGSEKTIRIGTEP